MDDKITRNKDKFSEMREHEENISQNPIRYGRQQFFKGKMAAYDRIQRVIDERRGDLDESDSTMHSAYKFMEDMISLLRKTES